MNLGRNWMKVYEYIMKWNINMLIYGKYFFKVVEYGLYKIKGGGGFVGIKYDG